MKLKFFSLFFLFTGLLGCGSSHPSAVVARSFVEAYYVKADLTAASTLAEGLALEKVKSGEKLREGMTPNAGIPEEAGQRRVFFKLIESKIESASATYLYRIEIKPQGIPSLVKKTLVRVRNKDGFWKVTQFTDHAHDVNDGGDAL